MITVFNRKEVYITYSMARQAAARSLLAQNHIDYILDTGGNQNRSVMNRNLVLDLAFDRALNQTASDCEYRFFVHKKDYEKALQILEQLKNQ